ncbi:GTP binding protein [Physocladia obscura]|uniref:GTP binding protein n=1 Tax=Physocladia obscura TaxID=109957 RepID=A0AAD5X7U3_9FUNG|nr:GTP binding protein [Physocladia obscura]
MAAHIDDGGATTLPQEVEVGNVEYKLKLINPPPERLQHLVTQLKWRQVPISSRHGEAIYEIGVSDRGELVGLSRDDMRESINTLRKMGAALSADVSIIRERVIHVSPKENKRKERIISNYNSDQSLVSENTEKFDTVDDHEFETDLDGFSFSLDLDSNSLKRDYPSLEERIIAEILVRKGLEDDEHFLEIRVAIVGGADAGKSTLLGVLADSELDNGRGKSRLNLLRHRHEIESGRTSSIGHQIIGFNARGALVNYGTTNISTLEQICESSAKIVSFMDMCGHPKYQKTTLSGLTGHSPDYACLIIGANAGGVSEVPREHLGVAVALMVPVFIVITKVDVASVEQLTRTVNSLLRLLKSPGICRVPMIIQNEDDLVVAVSSLVSSRVIPIFLTSSVTGENMNLLEKFLNLLPKDSTAITSEPDQQIESNEAEFSIEETYNISDLGYVVGGLLLSGQISTSYSQKLDKYYLGPDRGRFVPIRITSIHRQRIPIANLVTGQAATCAIMFVNRTDNIRPDNDGNLDGVNIYQQNLLIVHEELSQTPPTGFKVRKGQVILATCPNESIFVSPASVLQPSYPMSKAFGSFYKDQTLQQSTLSGSIFQSSVPQTGCAWEFEAEIHVIHAATKKDSTAAEISVGTSGVVYLGSIRQGARIVKLQDSNGKWAGLISDEHVAIDMLSPESLITMEYDTGTAADFFIVPSSTKSRRRSSSAALSVKPGHSVIIANTQTFEVAINTSPSKKIPQVENSETAANTFVSRKAAVSFETEVQAGEFESVNSSVGASGLLIKRSGTPTPSSPRRHSQKLIIGSIPSALSEKAPTTTQTFANGSWKTSVEADSLQVLPVLKTGAEGRIRLRFSHEPEWVKVGSTVLFRGEGRLKCVGKVVGIVANSNNLFSKEVVDGR